MLGKKIILENGIKIPVMGFGTWAVSNEAAPSVVREAISVGYRHFDTAATYGNEAGVGRGIQESNIAREEIYLTTKVPPQVKEYHEVRRVMRESMENLNAGYIDLMLLHAPKPWEELFGASDKNYDKENLEAWKALEEAQRSGMVRSIGVSNFEIEDLQNLLAHCQVRPQVNQIRIHIGHSQSELVRFCEENHIVVEAYSPIARGLLLNHPVVHDMARKYKTTISQLCIRYVLQLHMVVLVKSAKREHMIQNAELDFTIAEQDMNILKALDFGIKDGDMSVSVDN